MFRVIPALKENFMKVSDSIVCAWVAILVLQLTHIMNAQQVKDKHVSASQLHAYLRAPNGLAKLSSVVGDVSFDDFDERWGEHTLASLSTQSDSIVRATILERESHLLDDGNSIVTDYNVGVLSTLKGKTLSNLTVIARGGV
jgi:hypothetical protein